jgi:hypothetical protein
MCVHVCRVFFSFPTSFASSYFYSGQIQELREAHARHQYELVKARVEVAAEISARSDLEQNLANAHTMIKRLHLLLLKLAPTTADAELSAAVLAAITDPTNPDEATPKTTQTVTDDDMTPPTQAVSHTTTATTNVTRAAMVVQKTLTVGTAEKTLLRSSSLASALGKGGGGGGLRRRAKTPPRPEKTRATGGPSASFGTSNSDTVLWSVLLFCIFSCGMNVLYVILYFDRDVDYIQLT